MYLVLDLGNTLSKLALFEQDVCVQKAQYPLGHFMEHALLKWQAQYNITACILSSVIEHEAFLGKWLKQTNFPIYTLSHDTPLPIENLYQTPKSLGKDRIANAVGIADKNTNKNRLCIDFGTCIKYDVVSQNAYMGGAISMGYEMRLNALHQFTAKLPLLSEKICEDIQIGTDTESSMYLGSFGGILAEVFALIEQFKAQYSDLEVVITGGSAKYFENSIKKQIFVQFIPDLTLRGLLAILTFNHENK
jgi:type III pantothenate kinase